MNLEIGFRSGPLSFAWKEDVFYGTLFLGRRGIDTDKLVEVKIDVRSVYLAPEVSGSRITIRVGFYLSQYIGRRNLYYVVSRGKVINLVQKRQTDRRFCCK